MAGVPRKLIVANLVGAFAATALAAGTASARAASAQACGASQYSLKLQALTGRTGAADLLVRVAAASPCPVPQALAELHVVTAGRRIDLANLAAPGGLADVRVGRIARLGLVRAQVKPQPGVTLTAMTRALFRPDLAVRRVRAPNHALVGRPLSIPVVVRQQTRDVAATATITVSAGATVVGTTSVRIAPRRGATVRIPITLPAVGTNRLAVSVASDLPETAVGNNRRRIAIEGTQFELDPARVVVPSFAGYGGQFNHNVYAAISRAAGVSDANVGDMERKVRALHPQFSRIFFHPAAFNDPDQMQSFVRAVLLAQSTGTILNVTWQGGTLSAANGTVQKFGALLTDLVRNRGVTALRWVTLQNEPNRTRMTPEQYEAQYRALDPHIQSIRGQVKFMGGDLVRGPDSGGSNQQVWLQYMATHMADILDAYSIHVFWDYSDTQKLQDRLTEVRAIVDTLPPSGRKPLYVSEYGVRGLRTFNGAPTLDPGVWTDGTPITQTNVCAFQHAWFDLLASRLGYVGTSKWDAYFGRYDNSEQAYWMIGRPQDSWPLYPTYQLMQMITTHVLRGSKVVDVGTLPQTSQLVAAYVNPNGRRVVVGLDTAGAQLNDASGVPVSYTIGGFGPRAKLELVVWNGSGDGAAHTAGDVTADGAGVASVSIPQQAVFVLAPPTER